MLLLIQQCENSRSALLFVTHDSRLSLYFNAVLNLSLVNQASL
jgi:ABC-type lipoprotein export system ATPase subunit